jgi:hypothetical protein
LTIGRTKQIIQALSGVVHQIVYVRDGQWQIQAGRI